MRVPATQIREQLVSVFRTWGMSAAHAEVTADMMVETDLRGVDSHGISMLPTYDKEFRAGRLNMRPIFKTVREGPAFALIDADASLGHPVSVHAMSLAADKCRESGVAVVSVFNSHHFGAAGCYSKIAADRGVIGMVTSATRGVSMVPTFGAEPVMGTNPIAFAAPAKRNPAFQLDMATTTVAAGKVKVHKLNHRPLPPGWVVDDKGQPVTDPEAAFAYVFERPEGGITPRAFRAEGEFENDLDQVIDTLHGATRADPKQPVLVAGDPEMATRGERLQHGVPVPDDLMAQLRLVAKSANVPFVLTGS